MTLYILFTKVKYAADVVNSILYTATN